jgi:hypothetical protein
MFLDGEVVIIAGVEQGGDGWRASIPSQDTRDADLDDDLKGLDPQQLAMDIELVMLIGDGKSVQDLHEAGSDSSYSKKECSISSGSGE